MNKPIAVPYNFRFAKYLEAARRGLLTEQGPARRYNTCRGCGGFMGPRSNTVWLLQAPEGRTLVATEPLVRPVSATSPVRMPFCDYCSKRLQQAQPDG